jgi:hypothetical protein
MVSTHQMGNEGGVFGSWRLHMKAGGKCMYDHDSEVHFINITHLRAMPTIRE